MLSHVFTGRVGIKSTFHSQMGAMINYLIGSSQNNILSLTNLPKISFISLYELEVSSLWWAELGLQT